MKRHTAVCLASLGFVFILAMSPLLAQQTAQILPPLNVDKDKITFDPQTVAVGAFGSVHTGCEGAAVKITSREKGVCHFSYTTDGCGGVFGYYRGEVPVTAGLVTVENFNGGIRNSFPEKSLTLVRNTGPAVTVLVEGTGRYLTYFHGERRSAMEPRAGDRIKFRVRAYTSREFTELIPNAPFEPTFEFVAGQGSPWLETAREFMTMGDKRQIQIPSELVREAKDLLPAKHDAEYLYLELNLVSLERPK